jgi:hypothetical protein
LVADTAASRIESLATKKGTPHPAFNIRLDAVALMRVVAWNY